MSTEVNEEKKPKSRSKEYPAVTLFQAIDFVSKFRDYPHGKPISYNAAAKECGVSSSTKSFRYTISTAKQFGLISTSPGLTFTLLEPAYRLVRPTESEAALKTLKIECFSSPKLYKELISEYEGKSVPSINTLENLLVNYHHILAGAAKGAAQKFIDSATELDLIQNGVLCLDVVTETSDVPLPTEETVASVEVPTVESKQATPIDMQVQDDKAGFAAPLNIPFGDARRAMLYMPLDATKEDAEYVKEMIDLMFKRVYRV